MDNEQYITLKEYINYLDQINRSRIDVLEKLLDTKIYNVKESIKTTAEQLERRLESMNEFRESLRDQSKSFLPINEYNEWRKIIDDDIRILRESKANLEGKASKDSMIVAIVLSIISLFVSIIINVL